MRVPAMRNLTLVSVLATAACQGVWADQTDATLKPIANSGVKGIALISLGKACDDQGRCHYEGSNIWPQITSGRDTSARHAFTQGQFDDAALLSDWPAATR